MSNRKVGKKTLTSPQSSAMELRAPNGDVYVSQVGLDFRSDLEFPADVLAQLPQLRPFFDVSP